MTKYICDRCGNEFKVFEDNLFRIRMEYVDTIKSNVTYDLCRNCTFFIKNAIENMPRAPMVK